MVKGLREKQYQLAAQKRNEAHLRFNYYSQIAGYFERECAITRQYNSWVAKDSETSSSYLQKKVKEKKLQTRQEKLRRLLDDENRQFRQECEELTKRPHSQQRQEIPSLEALRQRLLEKKAEQSLYLPLSRKRHQAYFYNSDSLIENPRKSSSKGSYSASRMSLQGTCFENGYSQTPGRHQSTKENNSSPQHSYSYETNRDNARSSHQLFIKENVVTREVDVVDHASNMQNQYSYPETIQEESHSNGEKVLAKKTNVNSSKSNESFEKEVIEDVESARVLMNESAVNENHQFVYPENQKDYHSFKYFSKVDSQGTKNSIEHWESEKNLPWSRMGDNREQNKSIPMFMYLEHNDMKKKILDLGKRELQACRGYRYEEALRLRDMRNKLSLSREKNLLNAVGLELDEKIRNEGLKSITEREQIIKERETVCSNNCLYSEEAKDLWQKWVEEDRKIETKKDNVERERFMQALEQEWEAVAVIDKDRMDHLYENVQHESDLQSEHNLMKQKRAQNNLPFN